MCVYFSHLHVCACVFPPQMLNVGGQRRPPPRKIIMNVSVDEVQLKKSENAWKPGLKREVTGGGAVEDPDMTKTQVRVRGLR